MLIAIDHGNYSLKSVNCEPIKAGLLESDVRPFGSDILKYKGKYYQLSEQRIPYRRDKTEDERYFILTLFAIAHEIEAANAFFPERFQSSWRLVCLPRTLADRADLLHGISATAGSSTFPIGTGSILSRSTMWRVTRSHMPPP